MGGARALKYRSLLVRPGAATPLLFVIGLAVRVMSLPYLGTHDMNSYISWGEAVGERGLVHAFAGTYFPLQYQIFAGSLGFADAVGLGQTAGLKLVTLAFDIGSFVVLAALLARWGLDRRYVWIYWLSPYFLILNWLGYIDAQMGFLVLLSLYLADRASTTRSYLLAGVPLGLAFQMKPQVETVALMIVVYVVAEMMTRRSWRPDAARVAALVAPAIALFVGYSLYFWSEGAWLLELAKQYSPMYLALQMESLTANMLNYWYPIAYLELPHGERIYTVTGPSVLHLFGTALTLAVFGLAALAAARLPMSFGRRVFVAVALAVMMQPLTITISFSAPRSGSRLWRPSATDASWPRSTGFYSCRPRTSSRSTGWASTI